MAVTRSWEALPRPAQVPDREAFLRGWAADFVWLLGASLLVAVGLMFVYAAKTRDFRESNARLATGELLDVNTVRFADALAPFLLTFNDAAERQAAAGRIFGFLEKNRPLKNIGALSRLRPRIQVAKVKPYWIVRTPRQFTRAFVGWAVLYLAAFQAVFWLWRWGNFRGDRALLPALHLLSGLGLMLAVSLRDPLRDTLDFSKFAWGCAAGCLLLLLPMLRLFQTRRFAEWCYTPLFLGFALFVLLLRFGSGPGGSDSKVNLGPFQPVEIIKVLLVFFMAGYFARRWEHLRDLREKRLLPGFLRRWRVPRLSHVLPVMIASACSLGFFFLLKDLGPALVTGCLFLALFTAARGRAGLALFGVFVLVGGVFTGYKLGAPHVVVERISMWLSPWDNNIHGGNQLAHSLWAFATGGPFGSGPGWGDPGMIPAGHTDLVLPAISEEWGFAGVCAVFVLFGFLVWRGVRIALQAADEYAFFLALGLIGLISFEMLLISGGVLGAIPLSGVVSPFLSSGNTAMLSNFLVFALLLAISNAGRAEGTKAAEPFRQPVRGIAAVLALCALFALILLQPSCSSAKTPATVGGTPTGTYSLTVTATSGSFSQTQGFSVTVTP